MLYAMKGKVISQTQDTCEVEGRLLLWFPKTFKAEQPKISNAHTEHMGLLCPPCMECITWTFNFWFVCLTNCLIHGTMLGTSVKSGITCNITELQMGGRVSELYHYNCSSVITSLLKLNII
jgi:hypothetical protein